MNMILITLSSFLAIIVINTHIRGDRKNKVPYWLKLVRPSGLTTVTTTTTGRGGGVTYCVALRGRRSEIVLLCDRFEGVACTKEFAKIRPVHIF